jgi:hypothetical protein
VYGNGEDEQPHPGHFRQFRSLAALHEMFVWDGLIEQTDERAPEKHAHGDDEGSNPLLCEDDFRDFQAGDDERKERSRQHDARRETEHGVVGATRNGLAKKHRQRPERGDEPSGEAGKKAKSDRVHPAINPDLFSANMQCSGIVTLIGIKRLPLMANDVTRML